MEPKKFAIKCQHHMEPRASYDQTGGEPKDRHETVRIPGMAHGIESDPATEDQVRMIRINGDIFNEELNDKLTKLGFDHEKFGYFGFYLMDSDGKV